MTSPPNHPIAYSTTQNATVMIIKEIKQPKQQPQSEALLEVVFIELVVLELERLDDDWLAVLKREIVSIWFNLSTSLSNRAKESSSCFIPA